MIRSNTEKEMYKKIADQEAPLPFKIAFFETEQYGKEMFYIIPDDKREEVLKQLWVFEDIPSLDDEMYDIHQEDLFKMRDFKVIRFEGYNMLVSPYYFLTGGTILDIVKPNDSPIKVMVIKKK